jgi:hypothetical protein
MPGACGGTAWAAPAAVLAVAWCLAQRARQPPAPARTPTTAPGRCRAPPRHAADIQEIVAISDQGEYALLKVKKDLRVSKYSSHSYVAVALKITKRLSQT